MPPVITDAPRTDGPAPATGTFGVAGVGVGVGVAVGANVPGVGVAVACAVGCGVAVGPWVGAEVGDDVGAAVGVEVGAGVEVGVALGPAMLNVSVQAGAAAAGVDWGTVGATGWACCNFWVVKKITTPRPPVTTVSKIRCQCFLTAFIVIARLLR